MEPKNQTVVLQKDNVIAAYKSAPDTFKPTLATLFGKQVVFDKITERVHGWPDVCKIKGIHPVLSLPFPKASTEHEHYINAQHVLALSIEVLNEDWVADFNNPNQTKWVPCFEQKSGVGLSLRVCAYWDSFSYVGPRVCYASRELAEHGVKILWDYYKIVHPH